MTILLPDIFPITTPAEFKLHFARWNGDNQPLDVWVQDRDRWRGWQEHRPARNAFNRRYIFTLIHFYHETDTWLFGGLFRVVQRQPDRYEVALTDHGAGFVGRLKLRSSYRQRATRVNFENHYRDFEVQEILREPYAGRAFPGFEGIDLSFEELEALIRTERPDWKAALESVKGVYLITDTTTGRRYVGSASGDLGMWARWWSYVETGHGGNLELRALVTDPTLEYGRKAFRFALLEYRPNSTPDDVILTREAFWKRILLTRGAGGLNRH